MMLIIGICDKNETQRKEIEFILEKLFFEKSEVTIVHFSSHNSVMTYCMSEQSIDLMILNINMAQGTQTAEYIKEHIQSASVIVYTETDQYVFEGYQYHLFDYVLKSSDHLNLVRSVERYIKEKVECEAQYLRVRSGGCYYNINLADVLYFESRGRKISVVQPNGNFEFYQKMDTLYSFLPEDQFIRCHQSYIVRLAMIRSYTANSIVLKDGSIIPISRSRYLSDVKESLRRSNITENPSNFT